jgi:hypothetical protein
VDYLFTLSVAQDHIELGLALQGGNALCLKELPGKYLDVRRVKKEMSSAMLRCVVA